MRAVHLCFSCCFKGCDRAGRLPERTDVSLGRLMTEKGVLQVVTRRPERPGPRGGMGRKGPVSGIVCRVFVCVFFFVCVMLLFELLWSEEWPRSCSYGHFLFPLTTNPSSEGRDNGGGSCPTTGGTTPVNTKRNSPQVSGVGGGWYSCMRGFGEYSFMVDMVASP